MSLTLIQAPVVEPVDIDDLKGQLRLTTGGEDAHLERLIKAARATVENRTGRALITQQWKYTRDAFPGQRLIYLERGPLQSVQSLNYRDVTETNQVYPTDYWMVDKDRCPGRVMLKFQYLWPIASFNPSAVWVNYTAGYGDGPESVPEDLKMGILQLAAHWFGPGRDAVQDKQTYDVPKTIDWLIEPYKIFVPDMGSPIR